MYQTALLYLLGNEITPITKAHVRRIRGDFVFRIVTNVFAAILALFAEREDKIWAVGKSDSPSLTSNSIPNPFLGLSSALSRRIKTDLRS